MEESNLPHTEEIPSEKDKDSVELPILSHASGEPEPIPDFRALFSCSTDHEVNVFQEYLSTCPVTSKKQRSSDIKVERDEMEIFCTSESRTDTISVAEEEQRTLLRRGEPLRRVMMRSHPSLNQSQVNCGVVVKDEVFHTVQHIMWENAILWTHSIPTTEKESSQRSNDDEVVEEIEEDENENSSRNLGYRSTFGDDSYLSHSLSLSNSMKNPNNLSLHNSLSNDSRFMTSSSSSSSSSNRVSTLPPPPPKLLTDRTYRNDHHDVPLDVPRQWCWEINDVKSKSGFSGFSSFSGFVHDDRGVVKKQPSTLPIHETPPPPPPPPTSSSTTVMKKTQQLSLKDVKDSPLNVDFFTNEWVKAIRWNADDKLIHAKLVLDYNDSNLIFRLPVMEDIRPTLRIPKRKLGIAEERRAEMERQKLEKFERINAVTKNLEIGVGIANPQFGTDGKKTKDSRILKNVGQAIHSLPASRLVLTKPELPKPRLREFHRPRGKFKINQPIHITVPKSKPKSDESTQIRKPSDLNPSIGGFILIEYTEQTPPMLSNPGMASSILHYWRPPEKKEEDNGGKGKNKEAVMKPPEVSNGRLIELKENDDTPFVGDVPPGRLVTSLNCGLYKAPIFLHSPSSTFKNLFLLVRASDKSSKKTPGKILQPKAYIYEIPRCYLAGQIEPQVEVPAPNSRSANDFIRPYMSFHILRLFKKTSDGERLKIEDITRAFPNQSGTAIRKRMKEVATFERGGNDSGWWKKKSSSNINEDEMREQISPETVCLYESMMSGQRQLFDLGVTKLATPQGVSTAISLLLKLLKNRKLTIRKMFLDNDQETTLNRESERKMQEALNKDKQLKKIERDIQIARYIHEKLQLTPWNLTNNYVECHLQGKGSGMLKLGGVGDPTGRGEGFSFIRVPQSRAKKKEGEDADAAAQKVVAAVTGTTADLRKLKMKEAENVLRNLGMALEDIKRLRRWDRIHMVRELSSRATAHGVAGSLAKFARGARKSLSAQQQEYRRKCDVIYERQMEVLSSSRTSFSSDEEDEEEDDDLDELMKDVEDDILGAEDSERLGNRGLKNIFVKGGGGLNRSRAGLAERDDEAELRRLREEMKRHSSSSTNERRPEIDSGNLRRQLHATGMFPDSSTPVSGSIISSRVTSRMSSQPSSVPGSPAAGISLPGSGTVSRSLSPIQGNHRSLPNYSSNLSKGNSSSHFSLASSSSGENTQNQNINQNQNITQNNYLNPPTTTTTTSTSTSTTSTTRKVLKRTTRIIQEDGTENVKIEFILDERVIRQYQLKQERIERMKKELARQQKKRKRIQMMMSVEEEIALHTKAKKKKQLQEELRQLNRTVEKNTGYQEMLRKDADAILKVQPAKGDLKCTACGQIGHMKTNRDCPLYVPEDRGGNKLEFNEGVQINESDPLKLRIKKGAVTKPDKITVNVSAMQENLRKHKAEVRKKKMQEIKETAELYKRPSLTNKVRKRRFRMPIAHLNSKIEIVVYELQKCRESQFFRQPVDRNSFKDYYNIVMQPMDLSVIQQKVETFTYLSTKDFLKDVEQIGNNSRLYNGDGNHSSITKDATRLHTKAKTELEKLDVEGEIANLEKLVRIGNCQPGITLLKQQH